MAAIEARINKGAYPPGQPAALAVPPVDLPIPANMPVILVTGKKDPAR